MPGLIAQRAWRTVGRVPGVIRRVAYRGVTWARSAFGIGRAANFKRLEIAFVLPLSDEAHNYMRRIQVAILRRRGTIGALTATPHITLKLGFKTSDLGGFEEYLDELARVTPPVDIRLNGFDRFEEGIIFLDVEPDPALEQLRRRIVQDLIVRFGIPPSPLEGDRFHFHATLAHGLTKRQFETEFQSVTGPAPHFTFKARSLAILCHMGSHWITYRRANLQGNTPQTSLISSATPAVPPGR